MYTIHNRRRYAQTTRPETPEQVARLTGIRTRRIEPCFAPEKRTVIITGVGKAVCGGGDLKEMKEAGEENLFGLLGKLAQEFHRLILDIL